MDKKKLDLIKDFSKLWKFKEDDKDKNIIPKEEWVGYFDSDNVRMVVPKLKSIKKIIEDNFDINNTPVKIPDLNYRMHMVEGGDDKIKVYSRMVGEKSKYEENAGIYTPDLLRIILKLCTNTKSEKLIMKFRKDYPLWLETDEMICILAPRIEG